MSSSNLVRLAFIEEVTYGDTPGAGNFDTARFISEALSGTPETVESAQIRTDRQSSGQVSVGLTVGGAINFELAKESELEEFMESAMLDTFLPSALQSAVDLTIDATAKTITNNTGAFVGLETGKFVRLTGFTNTTNNTEVFIADLTSANVVRYVGPSDMVDEVGTNDSYQVMDELTIGTTKKSFSIEKSFLDLTDKAIIYKGMMANTMSFSIAYGELINGSFEFVGNYQQDVDAAVDFITDGRTVNAPATTQTLNGSIDMPYLATDATGSLDGITFCIQSLELSLNNNQQPLNCIGEEAAVDYDPGTAQIEISMSAYLSNENWSLLAKKKTQEAFALSFQVKNFDGSYAFYLPAIQVSFDDPSSGGANQIISMEMSGTAKVGSSGESALSIFK